MLTFVTGRCLLSSCLSSLSNGYSASATAGSTTGTDCLEFPVRRSAIALEFDERPRKDVHIAAVSFLETRRNRKVTPGE
jgi:hypothetical protein